MKNERIFKTNHRKVSYLEITECNKYYLYIKKSRLAPCLILHLTLYLPSPQDLCKLISFSLAATFSLGTANKATIPPQRSRETFVYFVPVALCQKATMKAPIIRVISDIEAIFGGGGKIHEVYYSDTVHLKMDMIWVFTRLYKEKMVQTYKN